MGVLCKILQLCSAEPHLHICNTFADICGAVPYHAHSRHRACQLRIRRAIAEQPHQLLVLDFARAVTTMLTHCTCPRCVPTHYSLVPSLRWGSRIDKDLLHDSSHVQMTYN